MTQIPFNIREAVDTGFFACGTSQTGKTTTCKHLVKQLVDTKVYRCPTCQAFMFSQQEVDAHHTKTGHQPQVFQDNINVYPIDISQAWTVDSPISNVLKIEPDTPWTLPANKSCVLDVSALKYKQRIAFVIDFSKVLYDWHVSKGYKAAPFEFIFYEEAHTYFPNGCFRSPRQFSPCIDVVTVGANFNLRFGAITQFPAMVDKALVKITQQRYFGRTTEKNDLSYIQSFIGNDYVKCPKPPKNLPATENKCSVCPKRENSCIRRLRKGQFLYQWNETQLIQSDAYHSKHAKPQENFTQNNFTMNGQTVDFAYALQDKTMMMQYCT